MNSMQNSVLVAAALVAMALWLTQGTANTRVAESDALDAGRVERAAIRSIANLDANDDPAPPSFDAYDVPPVAHDDASLATLPPPSSEAVDVRASDTALPERARLQ